MSGFYFNGRHYQGIIFDMDGTLVESEPVWEEAEIEMIEAHGNVFDPAVRQMIIGLRLDEFFQILRNHYQFSADDEALSEELIQGFIRRVPTDVRLCRGSEALIAWVEAQGIPTCIASSSPQSIIEAVVKAMGWDSVFSKRYSADLVTAGKPAPDVYLYAAEKLGLRPEDCVAIEDSLNGAKSAIAAGMTTIVVPDTSHSDPEQFKGIDAHMMTSLDEVLAALEVKE